MQKLNVGVLGCASIARRAMIPAFLANENISLVAVASRDLKKAQSFAKEFKCEAIAGYQNLLERSDIQAVYVPLPTGLHHEWVMKALRHGKHVIAEKSLAHSLEAVNEIVAEARQRKLVVFENFMFLYHSQLKLVHDMVEAGKIGTIHVLRSSFGFSTLAPGDFRFNKDLGGGSLLDVGTYTLKAAQRFLGSDLQVKAARLHQDPDHNVDVRGAVTLENKQGQIAQLAFGFEHFYQCSLELWGSKGRITMERVFTAPADVTPKIKIETAEGVQEILAPRDNHFVNIVREFAEQALSQTPKDSGPALINQARLLHEVGSFR